MDQRKEKENGAIIVEATFCLPMFVFVILTMLFVVKLAIVQARVNLASDAAAKDMAEYAHIYYATGMGDTLSGTGGKSSAAADKVGEYMVKIGNSLQSFADKIPDISVTLPSGGALSTDDITKYIEDGGKMVSDAGDAAKGDSVADYVKHGIGRYVGDKLIVDHLQPADTGGLTYEKFKSRYGILQDPYCTEDTNILESGGEDIVLTVETPVRVMHFFNIDTKYTLRHISVVHAWIDEAIEGSGGDGGAALPSAETTTSSTPTPSPTPAPPALPAAPTVPALPAPSTRPALPAPTE